MDFAPDNGSQTGNSTQDIEDVKASEDERSNAYEEEVMKSRIESVRNKAKFISKQKGNLYDSNSRSPFSVFIERVDESQVHDNKSISGLNFGRFCVNKFIQDIMNSSYNLRKSGFWKFSLNFQTFGEANNFIKAFNNEFAQSANSKKYKDFKPDYIFYKQDWVAYIPDFKIFYTMVLGGDKLQDATEGEILEHLRPFPSDAPWSTPCKVTQMFKFVRNESGMSNKVPLNFYKVDFREKIVPKKVSLYGLILYLNPFIPKVNACANCLRFGHNALSCKQKIKVCAKCACKGHSYKSCNKDLVRCVNCVRQKFEDTCHRASSNKCPVYIQNKDIKTLCIKFDKPFKDCQDIYFNFRGNMKDILQYFEKKNEETDSRTNILSYARVAKSTEIDAAKGKKRRVISPSTKDHMKERKFTKLRRDYDEFQNSAISDFPSEVDGSSDNICCDDMVTNDDML